MIVVTESLYAIENEGDSKLQYYTMEGWTGYIAYSWMSSINFV